MNYSEISALALSYTDREDSDIGARIPGFLFMVEAKLNRLLESNNMETVVTVPYSADNIYEYTLPTDFSDLRTIAIITTGDNNSKKPLDPVSAEQIANAKQNSSDGSYYSINKGGLEIYPALSSTQSIYIKYRQLIPPLSVTNVNNWLSLKYPDVYVFGLIVEICTFAKDWEAVTGFQARFENIIQDTIMRDVSAKNSGNSLRTRLG